MRGHCVSPATISFNIYEVHFKWSPEDVPVVLLRLGGYEAHSTTCWCASEGRCDAHPCKAPARCSPNNPITLLVSITPQTSATEGGEPSILACREASRKEHVKSWPGS